MRWLSTAILIAGVLLISQSFYMQAKSQLAQVLIAYSWQKSIDDSRQSLPPKPWWWADTRAIARLDVPRLQQQLYVMQDSSGESLAFGPGHLTGSSSPGQEGHVMVAGHRDSHFAFLEHIEIGDLIDTKNYRAEEKRYRVVDLKVLNTKHEILKKLQSNLLTLITCYPFKGWVPGGPLRYIVSAELVSQPNFTKLSLEGEKQELVNIHFASDF